MNRTPGLIPFRAEHLLAFVNRDGEANFARGALDKERRGPAFTAILDNRILGCAGVQLMWAGFGIAWAVFSKEMFDFPLWTTRTVRNCLRDIINAFELHRVEVVVLVDHNVNIAWATALGFRRENNGIARSYTPHRDDTIRYELVKEI